MAEPTLSLALEELRNAVTRYMSYAAFGSSAYSGLSTDKKAEIDHLIARGIRQFLVPPMLPGERSSHRWSFLVRPATLNLNAPSEPTDTVTVVSGVGTMSGGTLASWIASGVVQFNGSGPWYHVASRDGSTQFTLEDTSVAVSAGGTVEFRQAIVDLPDDFGGMAGPMSYEAGTGNPQMREANEGWIRRQAQEMGGTTGAPEMFAVRPRTWPSGTTSSTRWECLLWPYPDDDYSLTYVYLTNVNYPTGSTYYPVGGMEHSETILASCLAIAEEFAKDRSPMYLGPNGLFMQRLAASVSRDRSNSVGIIGYNGCPSDTFTQYIRHRPQSVQYNGQTYP